MADATTPSANPATEAEHEAALRLDAAARLLEHGDRARRLGIDPDAAARDLVAAADAWMGDPAA